MFRFGFCVMFVRAHGLNISGFDYSLQMHIG